MAKGFESKAVEEQIEEHARTRGAHIVHTFTPEDFEATRKREGLVLLQSRLKDQLSKAKTVTQRQMLHASLREIESLLTTENHKTVESLN